MNRRLRALKNRQSVIESFTASQRMRDVDIQTECLEQLEVTLKADVDALTQRWHRRSAYALKQPSEHALKRSYSAGMTSYKVA